MGAFVISKRFDDRYKYEFTSRKGKTIFSSIPYELKFECIEDIEHIKQNLANCVFEKSKSPGGKFFQNDFKRTFSCYKPKIHHRITSPKRN